MPAIFQESYRGRYLRKLLIVKFKKLEILVYKHRLVMRSQAYQAVQQTELEIGSDFKASHLVIFLNSKKDLIIQKNDTVYFGGL